MLQPNTSSCTQMLPRAYLFGEKPCSYHSILPFTTLPRYVGLNATSIPAQLLGTPVEEGAQNRQEQTFLLDERGEDLNMALFVATRREEASGGLQTSCHVFQLCQYFVIVQVRSGTSCREP